MDYFDPDTTKTDWSEFSVHEDTDHSLPIDLSDLDDYLPGEGPAGRNRQELADELMEEHLESQRRSKTQLHKMFDKFLYKK